MGIATHSFDALMDITARPPTVFVRGEGSYLFAEDGTRYLDLGAGIAVNAFGHANLATGEKLTPRHRFRIASHSKSFTAAGIMKLRERRKLRLDDPVGQYVEGLHPRVAETTIGQILSHSAGLVRDGATAVDIWRAQRPDLVEGDFAILMEPSDAVVEAGCQGTIRVEVHVPGEAAHSARSWMGSNAIHAAAPCPVDVKRKMLDWWGPVIWEYYGATDLHHVVTLEPGAETTIERSISVEIADRDDAITDQTHRATDGVGASAVALLQSPQPSCCWWASWSGKAAPATRCFRCTSRGSATGVRRISGCCWSVPDCSPCSCS